MLLFAITRAIANRKSNSQIIYNDCRNSARNFSHRLEKIIREFVAEKNKKSS